MQSIRTALRVTSAIRPGITGRNVISPAMVRAYHEKDMSPHPDLGYVALKANFLKLIDHYSNPRNVGALNRKSIDVGTGLVGAPACGDVIRLDIQVDEATGKITETRFKTFGCGSAIASSSYLTTLLRGKTLDEASKISNTQIASELCLPPVKLHCSLLAEDAVTAAIKNYRSKRIAPATDLAGTAKEIPKEAMQA